VNIATLSPEDQLALRDILIANGFEFEKRKCRRPGSRVLEEHRVGVRLLDKKNFGRVVIGVDLDAEKDQWFVAPNWESSQLNPEQINDCKDGKIKWAASSLISKVNNEFGSPVVSQPISQPGPSPVEEKTQVPEDVSPAPAADSTPKENPTVEKPQPEPEPELTKKEPQKPIDNNQEFDPSQVQIIKNVGQDKVEITKNTKGYNWVIVSYSDNMNEAIDKAIAADLRLKAQFGGGE